MRVVIQRVKQAAVTIAEKEKASISKGLLILVGFETADNREDLEWMTKKIVHLRIFSDSDGRMNESVLQQSGELLVVSQFTLHAAVKKGNRPSFIKAARPEIAMVLYEEWLKMLSAEMGKTISSGTFGADMLVQLQNDGPVTITIDTQNKE